MYLEIYEPHKLGEVHLDPYEWTYDGRYPEVEQLLEGKPVLKKGVAVTNDEGDESVDGEVELEGEEYLMRLSRHLKDRKVWNTRIVKDD